MLDLISLKCPNCNSNLEIGREMDRFACGYCGAAQIVNRAGGTVSLKLIGESISKVQRGTDRTAAELAIRRLTGEMQEIDATRQAFEWKKIGAQQKNRRTHGFLWLGASLLPVYVLSQGGWFSGLGLVLWAALTIGVVKLWKMKDDQIESGYRSELSPVHRRLSDVVAKIEENKRIVDGR